MLRRNLIVLAVLGASVGASRTAHAAPTACPTATLYDYLFSVHKCYLANVPMSDFTASLDLLGGAYGTFKDILVRPMAEGPMPGRTGFAAVGFEYLSLGSGIGVSSFSSGGLTERLTLDIGYRLHGTLFGMEGGFGGFEGFLGPSFDDATSGSWYGEVDQGYSDHTGCKTSFAGFEGDFLPDGWPTTYPLGVQTYLGERNEPCRMIAPVAERIILAAGTARGAHVDLRLAQVTGGTYEVFVTPEPSTWLLSGTGLGLLAVAGWRRRRQASRAS